MSRRDQLAAARARTEPAVPAKASRSLRPVRMSVDIDPDVYDALVRYSVAVAFERGLPPIHRVRVFRALLDELANSEALQARIADRLERE